jgi:hypothetical protein
MLEILLYFEILRPSQEGFPNNTNRKLESKDVNDLEVHHIASERLYELAQMISVTSEPGHGRPCPEWEHIEDCEECRLAFIMLKHVVEHSQKSVF